MLYKVISITYIRGVIKMANEHIRSERYQKQKQAKSRRKKRGIQKSILLVIWAIFAMIGIREIAHKTAVCITVIGENNDKSAVSNGRAGEIFRNKSTGKKENTTKIQEEHTKDIQATCSQIYNKNSNLLVLVNKDKMLEDSYNAGLIPICHGRLQASEQLYQDLVQMLEDAEKAGYKYWIASAYRSRLKQQQLIDEDVSALIKRGMTYEQALQTTYEETMPAGYSEHETGLALDILCQNNTKMDISQETEDANIWLREHCHEYGFILRYPKNKENVTKINYEPWHFRYVGKETAKFMKEQDIVLEEFYAMLEKE